VVFNVYLVRHSLGLTGSSGTSAATSPADATLVADSDRSLPPKPTTPKSDLPVWIQDYIRWHGQQRAALNATNWQDTDRFQFLVVRCLAQDEKCGGTADRLRPLPLYVWIAAHLQRILLIHWERPCALAEFLLPPNATAKTSGVDWRWPDFFPTDTSRVFSGHPELTVMNDLLPYVDTAWTTGQEKEEFTTGRQQHQQDQQNRPTPQRSPNDLPQFISMLYQSAGHGANFYNEHRYHHYKSDNTPTNDNDEPDHDHVFAPLWKAFFTPSPAVQSLLYEQRQALHLTTPNTTYVAVHIRSQYHNYNGDIQLRTLVRNAMNCASELQRKSTTDAGTAEPIFVATDSARAATAVAAYGKRRHVQFLQREATLAESAASASEPLHLDRGSAFLNHNSSAWTTAQDPADYYDTFVDLYLLAGSRCITYHVGGYGRWANLLSSNLTCELNHLKDRCSWTE
jgi:hypothetical protein